MRVRLMPTDDFAEFGKTRTTMVLLAIGPDEARRIMEDLENGPIKMQTATHQIYELLQAIAWDGELTRQDAFDIFNTDGWTRRNAND